MNDMYPDVIKVLSHFHNHVSTKALTIMGHNRWPCFNPSKTPFVTLLIWLLVLKMKCHLTVFGSLSWCNMTLSVAVLVLWKCKHILVIYLLRYKTMDGLALTSTYQIWPTRVTSNMVCVEMSPGSRWGVSLAQHNMCGRYPYSKEIFYILVVPLPSLLVSWDTKHAIALCPNGPFVTTPKKVLWLNLELKCHLIAGYFSHNMRWTAVVLMLWECYHILVTMWDSEFPRFYTETNQLWPTK